MNNPAFAATSRYAVVETTEWTGPDGRVVVHLKRRFLPSPERFALLQEHAVVEGDRPDNLAAIYLGDPEQFWRLADANRVMFPTELTDAIGRRIRITLPEGIPAAATI